MSEKILVPALGESITEATVAKWLKSPGEKVEIDEPIVELETDKVNLEVPSPITGVLTEINSKDGSVVEVGSLLGSVSDKGQNVNLKSTKKEEINTDEVDTSESNVIKLDTNKKEPKIFDEKEIKKNKQKPLVLTESNDKPLVLTDEILQEESLPLRRVAVSPCFRREAGTYGKDTKGLYRVHQFWKVEQVVIGPNDITWSFDEHERMLGHATSLMQKLELPYRVVNVCGGDLGQGQVQKYDIETWMPSRNDFGETHSASRFYDFQTRRLNIRYRKVEDNKPHYCHSLNNTVIASPRVLIALLENHQLEGLKVRIPSALQPYMQGRKVIG